MLRYKTILDLTLYDIRPGNRAGLFLQPWSLHRAWSSSIVAVKSRIVWHSGASLPRFSWKL